LSNLYNTNLNFIGYQEKLTPVPYFSSALHCTACVTNQCCYCHHICLHSTPFYHCHSVDTTAESMWDLQEFWTSGKCLLAWDILIVSAGKWNAEYSCTTSCAEWNGWLLANFRNV